MTKKYQFPWFCVVAVVVSTVQPARADVALMLNDLERQKLIQMVARGLAEHPEDVSVGVYLLNKIQVAPVITDQKTVVPDIKPAPTPPATPEQPQ